jgi:arylsulfatase A-like enzyme
LIEFIDSNKHDGKPFFAFAAYTSPHWPLQVPDEHLNLYAGRYDDGYDALRELNFAALKTAGIIPSASSLPPRNDAITPWEELSVDEQRRESRKMEFYASMVDNLDGHIGHLLDHLKKTGLYENTLIVFMSDNGAAGEDFYNEGPFTEYIQAHFDNAYETIRWRAISGRWLRAADARREHAQFLGRRDRNCTFEGLRDNPVSRWPRVPAAGRLENLEPGAAFRRKRLRVIQLIGRSGRDQ